LLISGKGREIYSAYNFYNAWEGKVKGIKGLPLVTRKLRRRKERTWRRTMGQLQKEVANLIASRLSCPINHDEER